MTAGTVVITGGILATVILLCIIAVLCYCRLQVSAGDVPVTPGGLRGSRQHRCHRRDLGGFSLVMGRELQHHISPGAAVPPPKAFEDLQHLLIQV